MKKRPKTFPESATKSRHYPMWLYRCVACKDYSSWSGIVEIGEEVLGSECSVCGGTSFPVSPYRITGFVPFSA